MKKAVGYIDVVIPTLIYMCIIFTVINVFSVITAYSAYSNVADVIIGKSVINGKVDYTSAEKYVEESGLEITDVAFLNPDGTEIPDGGTVQYGNPVTVKISGNIYPKYISKSNTLNSINFVKSKNSLIYSKE